MQFIGVMLSMLIKGEREERKFAKRYVNPRRDVVDLGAGQLLVGREVIPRLLPGSRYVGLEMQPLLAREADQKAKRIVPVGVHASVVHGAICSTEDTIGIWGSGPSAATMKGPTVPCTTLSRLIVEHRIREGYTLLMDIEGGETDVIRDPALLRCGVLVAELHDCQPHVINPWGCSATEALERLQALGFALRARGRGEVYVLTRAEEAHGIL